MTIHETGHHADKIADRMHQNPVTIDPDASLDEAQARFKNYGFRHLPVVTCNEVVGIISDRDLRLATGLRPDKERLHDSHGQSLPGPQKVSEIMSAPVKTLTDEDTFEDAALIMLQDSLGAVPICADEQLVGILTETDVLRAYQERFESDGAPQESSVRARMRAPIKTVNSATKVDEALDVLDRDARHLIVVDEDCMTGILSERDLLLGLSQELTIDERAQSEGRYAETELPVQSIMSRQVTSISENASLSRAAELMVSNKFSALPVLDSAGAVMGIVTQRDIIEEYVARLDG